LQIEVAQKRLDLPAFHQNPRARYLLEVVAERVHQTINPRCLGVATTARRRWPRQIKGNDAAVKQEQRSKRRPLRKGLNLSIAYRALKIAPRHLGHIRLRLARKRQGDWACRQKPSGRVRI